jgi:translation initiation factor 4G
VADIERMAAEASSMPQTPLDGPPPRTPGIPSTPRTPGTPGFGGLPAKPQMTSVPSSTNVKLDAEALEKRKRPAVAQLDLSKTPSGASSDAPMSAALQSLGSARFIEDISKVAYPTSMQSPKPELNESAEPGKFRYDRDFLLQFMGVYKEKPVDLPPLADIGMDPSQAQTGRSGGGRRTSGMGPPAPPGRGGSIGLGLGGSSAFGKGAGGMGSFAHPKTSEERFAASSARSGSAFGSGPMGSFNAGARSQPLSRPASGSSAMPSRDMMGTGVPAGGRSKSGRGRAPNPNAGGGGRNQVNPPEKGGPTIPLDQVVPLAMSETRWQGTRGAQSAKADSPEMVQRKVKALLNKLTLEKFDSISNQVLEWANKSVDETDGRTLRQVIALIFEKATDEAAWSEMYARLCRKLNEELSPDVRDEALSSESKPAFGGTLFRKYLINRCQEDFEHGWAARDATVAAAKSKEVEDKAKKEQNERNETEAKEAEARGEKPAAAPQEAALLSEEYYEAAKAKRRGLGLVRFIGELYKLGMLTERIMHLCIKKLLANATDPEEEEIESLCKLLTTVGKTLDGPKAKQHIDIYFTRMAEMRDAPGVNSRMAFMLQDVIELRSRDWIPRHDNAAPKTIAQIHADVSSSLRPCAAPA